MTFAKNCTASRRDGGVFAEWRGGPLSRAMVRYLQAVYTRHDNDETLAESNRSSYSSWMPRIATSWRACRKKAVAVS